MDTTGIEGVGLQWAEVRGMLCLHALCALLWSILPIPWWHLRDWLIIISCFTRQYSAQETSWTIRMNRTDSTFFSFWSQSCYCQTSHCCVLPRETDFYKVFLKPDERLPQFPSLPQMKGFFLALFRKVCILRITFIQHVFYPLVSVLCFQVVYIPCLCTLKSWYNKARRKHIFIWSETFRWENVDWSSFTAVN